MATTILLASVLSVGSCGDGTGDVRSDILSATVRYNRFPPGSNCTIGWEAEKDVVEVKLELSRDSGATWEVIADSVPATDVLVPVGGRGSTPDLLAGEHDWIVTDGGKPLPQMNCLVRVSDAASRGQSAVSVGFVIANKIIWHVDKDAPSGGDGLSWAAALQLPGVVYLAMGSDEVWIAEGSYSCTIGNKIGVSYYGGFAGTEANRSERDWILHPTVLDGSGVMESIVTDCYGVTLDGLTITGALSGDSANNRGAIEGINIIVTNCVIANNSTSTEGGGIRLAAGTLTVQNCIFLDNHADVLGGAIYVPRHSTYDVSISNCIFAGNSAGVCGGAIFNSSTVPISVSNCTFFGNVAGSSESALFAFDAMVRNSIFWDDAGVSVLPGLLDVAYSDVRGGYTGTGNIDADPLFADPSDPDGPDDVWGTADDGLRLQAGSPGIDAADGDAAPAFDILGNPRVDDPGTSNTGVGTPTHTDMGAYEFQP